MIRFWPWEKNNEPLPETLAEALERVSKSMQEYSENLCKILQGDIDRCDSAPKEKKMKKDEARKAAETASLEMLNDGWTVRPIEDNGTQFDVSFKKENDFIGRIFPYTPEQPPIKNGVLCVGKTRNGSVEYIGKMHNSGERGGVVLTNGWSSCVVTNARPVTPEDLVRWGWEEPKECADCKHDSYGYDPHGDEPCASCCKSSKNRPNFEPKQ